MRSSSRLAGSLALVATSAALLACGSSSSSGKSAYCNDRGNLQQSVSDLKGVDVASGGLDAVQSQLAKVDSNARALVASAKADFPQQTSAISSSVAALDSSAKSLGSAPSAKGVVNVGQDVSGVVTAFQGFSDATKDKC
jgi:hypothetical protein